MTALGQASLPLYFVTRYGQTGTGSTQMRSTDLLRIISPYLTTRITPSIITMPGPRFPILQRLWARARPKGGLYFLTKSAQTIDPEAADTLRRRSRGIALDYVDSDLTLGLSQKADVHICSSFAQEDRIRALQAQGAFAPGPTKVILHNPSHDLYALSVPRRDQFATVYFGTPSVTRIPEALASQITVLDTRDHASYLAALPELARFPLHYCFRRDREVSDLLVKPFTKGITASMCSVNLITSRDVPDAVRLLGDDYPFLADGNSDADILDAHSRARTLFNGPEWTAGLERLAALKEEVSGPSLARRVQELAAMMGDD
ncbi:MAG: hypothetical protein ACK47C_14525 [Paracoccaceae bacterium]